MTPRYDSRRMLDMIGSAWVTRAICTFAELGLPDLMKPIGNDASQAPREATLDELAARCNCDPAFLHRLLQALQALEVCACDDAGHYGLTALGATLRTDHPGSVKDWAVWWGKHLWPLWGQMSRCIQSGQTARQQLFGLQGYAHLDDPTTARQFHAAMTAVSRWVAMSLVDIMDFSGVRRVLDVGGGHGELVVHILKAHPHLTACIQDLGHALHGARERLLAEGLADRCSLIEASFFDTVAAGADLLLLKSILHNWNDSQCHQILERCTAAMKPGARLVLVERLLPEGGAGDHLLHDFHLAAHRSDLNMLVGLQGRERTLSEYETLLQNAGLRLSRSSPLAPEFYAIEAVLMEHA